MLNVITFLIVSVPVLVAGIVCNYTLIGGPFEWAAGRQQCIDAGMDLAIITDSTMQEEVETFLSNQLTGSLDVWIGLFWITSNEAFQWVNDEYLVPDIWNNWEDIWKHWDLSTREPNCMDKRCNDPSRDNQNCVRMVIDRKWKSAKCANRHAVLCQTCLVNSVSTRTTLHNPTTDTTVKATSNDLINALNLETTTHNATITDLNLETTSVTATNNNLSLFTTSVTTTTNDMTFEASTYNDQSNNLNLNRTSVTATDNDLTNGTATSTLFTLRPNDCDVLCLHQCACNCHVPSATGSPNSVYAYRLDKTKLSSYLRKKNSAADPRQSSIYIGCVGVTVLVLSGLFVVVLDFLPTD